MKVRKIIEKECPELGLQIRQARLRDDRPLTQICALAGMTTANWYKIEGEQVAGLPLETLRRIEGVLGVDFGVSID